MEYFVIQIRPGYEDRYMRQAARCEQQFDVRVFWPRRKLNIRRGGRWRNSTASIFPGYVFLQSEQVTGDLFSALRRVPGFYRFLKSNENIEPLSRRDRGLLEHFLSFGQVVERSVAYFDENKKICVVSGPLRGLEGSIVKVDRRKGRARVKLDLYDDAFLIDFGFEDLEQAPVRADG